MLPTRYWVRPKSKKYGSTGHNAFIKDKTKFEDRIIPPEICPNFDPQNSIYDVIEHYCPKWSRTRTSNKRIERELKCDVLLIFEPFSKRGMLVLSDPRSRSKELLGLSFTKNNYNPHIASSIYHHLAKIRIRDDIRQFIGNWKYFVEKSIERSRDERDMEQKRDDLERIGIKCFFYRKKGVDSTASKVTLKRDDGTDVHFNVDIESKFSAASFFRRSEAGDIEKYPRLPVLILCHADDSNQNSEQYFAHPIFCIRDFLMYIEGNPIRTDTIAAAIQDEIDRLIELKSAG
jgi:hypothetical protein